MPKRKAARKQASSRRSKRKAAPKRKRSQAPVAVGEAVRLPPEGENKIACYDRQSGGQGREETEGIVCAIRDIRSGKLVAKTRGALTDFVLEILQIQSSQLRSSSDRRGGGYGVPTDSPVWGKLQGLLQEMAGRGEYASAGSGALLEEPFSSLLDGWRVVKAKAEEIEPLS